MIFQNKISLNLFIKPAKAMAVFITGGILVHVIVMILDYYLMIKPLYLNLHEDFVGGIFSMPMFPMMVAYGLLSLTIFFLWEKRKKTLLLVREKEIQKEKVEAVLASMQRLTGILAEHIATYNSQIMSWAEFRKRRGRPVSEKVEIFCQKIAKTLQSLSQISFVFPYTEHRPVDVADIEKILLGKLHEINAFREGEEYSAEPNEVIKHLA